MEDRRAFTRSEYLRSIHTDSYEDYEEGIWNVYTPSYSSEEEDFSSIDQFLGEYIDLSYDNLRQLSDRQICVLEGITSKDGYYTPRIEKDELGLFGVLPEELLLRVIDLIDDGKTLYILASNFSGFGRLINLPGIQAVCKAKAFSSCLEEFLEINILEEYGEEGYVTTGSPNNFLAWFEGNFYTERLDKHSKAYYNLKHDLSYFDENTLPTEDKFQLLCSENSGEITEKKIEILCENGAYILLKSYMKNTNRTNTKKLILEVLSRYVISQKEFLLFILLTYAPVYTEEVNKIMDFQGAISFTSTELISFYEDKRK